VVYRMVDYANQSGGGDNVSVIIVEALDQVKAPPAVRGQKPAPVDWETVPTISKDFIYKEKKRFGNVTYARRKKTRQKAVVLAGIGAGVLVITGLLLGIMLISGILKRNSQEDALSFIEPTIPMPMESINAQLETAFTPEVEPGLMEADLEPTYPVAEANEVNGETQNPGPIDGTVEPQETDYDPEQMGWCTYEINYDNLNVDCAEHDFGGCKGQYPAVASSRIFDLFCLVKCKFPEKFLQVENQLEIYAEEIKSSDYEFDPSRYLVINHGWILKFPDITYRDCTNAGGDFSLDID
jgi:hypothetical protein